MYQYKQAGLWLASRRQHYGNLLLRIIVGWRLIDGVQDNIFDWNKMLEFKNFLASYHVSFPLTAAVISCYAQFICGILYIIGLMFRFAALIMIINFIVALIIVHIGLSFQESFAAFVILAASVNFLFYGAGTISVDHLFLKNRKP